MSPSEKFQSTNSEQCNQKLLEFYSSAPYVSGYDRKFSNLANIPWVKQSSIKNGVKFYKKYFSTYLFASWQLVFLFICFKPFTSVFYHIGGLYTDPEAMYKRMLRTIDGVDSLYKVILSPNKAKKYFEFIRRMHILAATRKLDMYGKPGLITNSVKEKWKTEIVTAIKADMEAIHLPYVPSAEEEVLFKKLLVWNPLVKISQLDMMLVAVSTFGAFWARPKYFGVENRQKDMAGVIHLWAVFSKLLGIEDDFNLCLANINSGILDRFIYTCITIGMKNIDEMVVTCQNTYVEGFRRRLKFTTYKGILYSSLNLIFGDVFVGTNLWNLMDWKDKLCVMLIKGVIWATVNIPGALYLLNILVKLGFKFTVEQKGSQLGRAKVQLG